MLTSRTQGPFQITFVGAFVDASQREDGDVFASDIWEMDGEELVYCKYHPHLLEDLLALCLLLAEK